MKLSFRTLWSYITIILLLLSEHVLIKYISNTGVINMAIRMVLFGSCLVEIALCRQISINKRFGIVFMLLMVYMAGYIVMNRVHVASYLLYFFFVICLFSIYCAVLIRKGMFRMFIMRFSNVIIFLATSSVILWLLGTVVGVLPGKTVSYEWGGIQRTAHNYFLLYNQVDYQAFSIGAVKILRNCGIYTEAPGFASFLLYALAIETLVFHRPLKNRRCMILLIAALSTLCAKALIGIMLILGMKYVFATKAQTRRQFSRKALLTTVIVVAGSCAVYYLMEIKGETLSYAQRVDDALGALKAWLDHPFFGVGFINEEGILPYLTMKRGNVGLSMGMTVLLAEGGLYLALLYFIAAIIPCTNRTLKKYRRAIVMFAAVVFFNLVISNVPFTMTTLMILAGGYASLAYTANGRAMLQKG